MWLRRSEGFRVPDGTSIERPESTRGAGSGGEELPGWSLLGVEEITSDLGSQRQRNPLDRRSVQTARVPCRLEDGLEVDVEAWVCGLRFSEFPHDVIDRPST